MSDSSIVDSTPAIEDPDKASALRSFSVISFVAESGSLHQVDELTTAVVNQVAIASDEILETVPPSPGASSSVASSLEDASDVLSESK